MTATVSRSGEAEADPTLSVITSQEFRVENETEDEHPRSRNRRGQVSKRASRYSMQSQGPKPVKGMKTKTKPKPIFQSPGSIYTQKQRLVLGAQVEAQKRSFNTLEQLKEQPNTKAGNRGKQPFFAAGNIGYSGMKGANNGTKAQTRRAGLPQRQ